MADITMCNGKNCNAKNKCYRYTAPINKYWQAYFVDTPGEDIHCEYYLPVAAK